MCIRDRFEASEEAPGAPGLGVLRGEVKRLTPAEGVKIPHMGWNQLEVRRDSPILSGVPRDAGVYFVHGYHVTPQDETIVATTTDYGRPFVSSIWNDNVMATQFHPEKSQKVGLRMLANFAAL